MGREGKEVGFGDLLVEGAKGVGGKGGRCVGVEVLRWLLCSFSSGCRHPVRNGGGRKDSGCFAGVVGGPLGLPPPAEKIFCRKEKRRKGIEIKFGVLFMK